MPRETEPSVNEKAFLFQALEHGIRVGKTPELCIQFGDEPGTVDVSLGKTRLSVRVSADVTAPYTDRKFEGILTINTELSPMASPAFETGRQLAQEALISRALEKAIRRSHALDTESLCIIAGQKVWTVRADVHVLNHDGGLVDAACAGIISAMSHFRRPDISIDGRTCIIHPASERQPVPLTILHMPFCVTLSLYHNESMNLSNGSLLESQCADGQIIVTGNKHGDICQIAKFGGMAIDAVSLLQLVGKAFNQALRYDQVVSSSLKQAKEMRANRDRILDLISENDRVG